MVLRLGGGAIIGTMYKSGIKDVLRLGDRYKIGIGNNMHIYIL